MRKGARRSGRRDGRAAGSVPLTLIDAVQDSHETAGAATGEILIAMIRRWDGERGDQDIGEGRVEAQPIPGHLNITPAHTDAHYLIEGEHRLLLAAFPAAKPPAKLGADGHGGADDPLRAL